MSRCLAELKRLIKPWARSAARTFAPAGTKRRRVLEFVMSQIGYGVWSSWRPGNLAPFPEPLERAALNVFLARFGIEFPESPQLPVTEANAARRVLEILVASPELLRQFPQALSEGGNGPFANWLEREGANRLSLSCECVRLLKAALERRPGRNLLRWCDHFPPARQALPLFGLGGDRGPVLAWFLHYRQVFDLDLDDILWFFLDQAQSPSACLAQLFLRQPEWQKAVPEGLSRSHWSELCHWLKKRYRLSHLGVSPDDWHGIPHEEASPTRRGVNVLGHLCYPSGLQVAALNTIAALRQAGWTVSCRDVPSNRKADLPNRHQYLGLHPFPITISQLPPEPLAANAYPLAGLAMRPDTYRIGYWYWELEQAPRSWNRHRHWLHELWAPTRFIGDALRGTMPLPVFDMLPGMTMPPEVILPRSRFGIPEDRFAFLFMFDMGSTMERKNPLATVEAFLRAFGAYEPVVLVIKVSRGWQDPNGLDTLKRVADGKRIFLLDEVYHPEELFGMLNCCDAYVSLHRSEGFGLTMAEAMALGKPVVATGYSGNLDFMDDSNSLLVRHEKVPIRTQARVYRKGYLWAEPSVEHAAELMRWIYKHPVEAQALGQRARVSIRATLSIEAAARRMTERLEALRPPVPLRRAA